MPSDPTRKLYRLTAEQLADAAPLTDALDDDATNYTTHPYTQALHTLEHAAASTEDDTHQADAAVKAVRGHTSAADDKRTSMLAKLTEAHREQAQAHSTANAAHDAHHTPHPLPTANTNGTHLPPALDALDITLATYLVATLQRARRNKALRADPHKMLIKLIRALHREKRMFPSEDERYVTLKALAHHLELIAGAME